MTELELADDLGALLTLERVDRDLFRGRNANSGPRQTLYGGQVAAQCLVAAGGHGWADRLPHSLHGYFLRAGRSDLPVILEVDRDRDGRSFSARHVVAMQEGEVIFSMVTSFHTESEGGGVFDAAPRRDVPEPDAMRRGGWNPLLEVREVTPTDFLKGVFSDCVWVRSATALGDDPLLHRAALTYLSDIGTGFGQQDRGAHRARWAVHRPCNVVPGEHPGRRLGPPRPASRQGAAVRGAATRGRCGTVRGRSARRSTRSSSCCQGP